MILLHNLPVLVVSSGCFAFLISKLLNHGGQIRREKASGCQPISRYGQWEPFFGLDLVVSMLRSLKYHYYLDFLINMHKNMPKTFSINFFGSRQIWTIEPENLKAIQATNFHDFGIEAIRRRTKGSMPFADAGISTTDGKDWEFSRYLVKPFFYRDHYTSVDRLRPFVDRFMTLLPENGETFNAQPLVQRWVSQSSSPFVGEHWSLISTVVS